MIALITMISFFQNKHENTVLLTVKIKTLPNAYTLDKLKDSKVLTILSIL